MIREADINGDGKILYESFLKTMVSNRKYTSVLEQQYRCLEIRQGKLKITLNLPHLMLFY